MSEWFRTNLRDPRSFEVIEATKIEANLVLGGCVQFVTYRAKNGFGGYSKDVRRFVISHGKVIDTFAESDDQESLRGFANGFRLDRLAQRDKLLHRFATEFESVCSDAYHQARGRDHRLELRNRHTDRVEL